jgi:hypothetical protein
MTKQLYTTISGLTDSSIRNENGTLLVLPTASGAVLNLGTKIQEITSMSRLGQIVVVDTYPMESRPEIKMDWTQKNLTLLQMRLGLEFTTGSATGKLVNNGFKVLKSSYPAVTSGQEGFGIDADNDTAIASYLSPADVSVPLTRTPFASFDVEDTLSFAIGEDAAFKWSGDLIGKYVAMEVDYPLSSVMRLSDNPINNYSLTMMTILTDRTLLQWEFPSVSIKLDQGDINMGEPKMELTFQIQDDGSSCIPFKVTHKGVAQKRRCIV